MIIKKICMVGSFAVGKTALLNRFVNSIFSDDYLSTVGVKISKKTIELEPQNPITLMLWDLEGRDDYGDVNLNYLRGANGFILVVDGTRGNTLKDALSLREKALGMAGEVPYLFIFNKDDLRDQWEIEDADMDKIRAEGHNVISSSAKTGNNVESAFIELCARMLDKSSI